MNQEQTSWKKYLQEMDVNVTVTADDEKSESPFTKKDKKSDKGNPFEKKGKSDKKKGGNPFAKKDDGDDKPEEKKDNPFVAKKGKSDKKKGGNPFAKKDDGGDEPKEKGDKSENPFVKKESFLSWHEWVEAKNS